jgi:glycosyltransferase involved in cell wall biosynthesis
MKLLIISPQANQPTTDAFQVFRNIGFELQKRGHSVDYYLPPANPKTLNPNTNYFEQAIRIAPNISQACKQKRYDIIIAPNASGWCLATFRKWLLPRKTKIVSWYSGQLAFIQDVQPTILSHQKKSSPFTRWAEHLHDWIDRHTIKTQDGCFLSSVEERDWVHKKYPLESRKAIYLPNGASSVFYYPERYEQFQSAQKLLVMGTWQFDQPILDTVLIDLLKQTPNLQLSLLQPDCETETILKNIPQELHSAIRILPQVDEKTRIALYRDHDILILPNTPSGPPLILLEALASGLPIIATDGIGRKELIRHYENGLLIPPHDSNALKQSLNHLLENPELCRQLGEAAYETASLYYTWRQVSDIFEEKLRQILHNKLPLPDWMIVTSNA